MDNVHALLNASARSRMVVDANLEQARPRDDDGDSGFGVVLSGDGGAASMSRDMPGYWAPTDMATIMTLFSVTWAHTNILPIDRRFMGSDDEDMGYDADEDRFDINISSLTFHGDNTNAVSFDRTRNVVKIWPGTEGMGNTAGSVVRINNTVVREDMHLIAGVANIGETGPCGVLVTHRAMLENKSKMAATLLGLKARNVLRDSDDADGEGMLIASRPHRARFYRCVVPLTLTGKSADLWTEGTDMDADAAVSPLTMSLVHGDTVIMPGAHRWVLDLTACADAVVGIPGVLPCCVADHAMVCVGVVCDMVDEHARHREAVSVVMISPLIKNRRMAHLQRYLWQAGCMRLRTPFDAFSRDPREAQDCMARTLALDTDTFSAQPPAVDVPRTTRALNGIEHNFAVRISTHKGLMAEHHSLRPRGAIYMAVHKAMAAEQDMLAKDAVREAAELMHNHRHQNILLTIDGKRVHQ